MPSGAAHRGMLLHRRWHIAVYLALGALASFCWCYQGTMLAIRTVRRLYALRVPANTPWNRVRLALGFGTRAASKAIEDGQ